MKKILLLTYLILSATALHAQDKTPDIDKIFSWATPSTPGCAVAASLNGKLVVSRAYGSADLERDVPIRPDTVFDAGSLTKQFVAATVLTLADEGRLALSDDVRKYIPELPDYGRKITIDHLLTHTSGLRDWTGMEPLTNGNADAFHLILRQRALNFTPGDEFAYSNSGFVLLKEIVTRVSGMPFADFARKRLFEPLGLKVTSYQMDLREVVKNRALAYDKEGGRWRMSMLLDNDRGGGGALLSTTNDLLTWNDALTNARLGKFVTEKIQEAGTLNSGRKLGYARGLYLDSYRGSKMVGHTGSAAGYKSLLVRYPDHALSIAIMCNSGDDTDRMAFARQMFDLYVPAAPADDVKRPPVAKVDASGKAGLFFNERGEPLRLGVQNGFLRVPGGPALEQLDENHYRRFGIGVMFMSGDEFELQFTTNDEFDLKSTDGKTIRYRRAQRFAPAAADLEAFAGRYESDEIGTVFVIAPSASGLSVQLEHSPEKTLEVKPVDRDTFQRGMMTLRFKRDQAGNVVALDYSNPVLRNVKFRRVK